MQLLNSLEQAYSNNTPACPIGQTGRKENNMRKFTLLTGVEFTAKSKTDSYRYRMIGIDPTHDHTYNIRLLNLDTEQTIYVESAWFGEREISVTYNEKGW
jgi:hypothetical protein